MVTSAIKAAVSPGKGFWDCVDKTEVDKISYLVKKITNSDLKVYKVRNVLNTKGRAYSKMKHVDE